MATITVEELRRLALASPLAAHGAVMASMPAIARAGVSGVRKHFQRQESPDGIPWAVLAMPRVNGGSKILRDMGLLAASVTGRVTETGIVLTASHVAANVHQFGATITPKSGKYLAIPLTKEAKRAGSPRQFPRRLFCVAPKASKNLYLVEANRRKGIVYQYILKKSVTIPARPYMGFSPETLRTIEKIIGDRAERVLARMFDPSVRLDPVTQLLVSFT